jgi:hypothetical protein
MCSPWSNSPELQKSLRRVEDDAAALLFQKGSDGSSGTQSHAELICADDKRAIWIFVRRPRARKDMETTGLGVGVTNSDS